MILSIRLALKEIVNFNLLQQLSDREIQCLYYLCKGFSYKSIGSQLNISPRTAETHISNAKYKLHITTKSALIKVFANIDE